jgi:glycosyltransferase involved in cell wall biosynthesis
MLTYNREKLMPLMAQSVLAQDFSDFEFIIIDNGSTDKSGDLAEEFAEKDRRVRVIHTARGNIGSGRNAGLDAATGQYIAFVDDDDTLTPDYLSFHKALIDKYDADISICGTTDRANDKLLVMPPEEALVTLFERKLYNVGVPAKVFKSDLFSDKFFSEIDKTDDIGLIPEIISRANKILYHGLPKYVYNRHTTNSSAWITDHSLLTPEILNEYLQVYTERTDYLCRKFPEKAAAWNYYKWSFMISMVEKITRLNLNKCKAEREKYLSELQKNKDDFLNSALITDFEKKWIGVYLTQ